MFAESVGLKHARALTATLGSMILAAGCGADGSSNVFVRGPSPQSGQIAPCNPVLTDAWRFNVKVGDSVLVSVDTNDPDSAADMELRGACGGKDAFFGDDNFLCQYPPPRFSCPAAGFEATVNSRCVVDVSPALTGTNPPVAACTDSERADYDVSVEINGEPAVVALIRASSNQACAGGSNNGRSCDTDRDCPDGACVRETGLLTSEFKSLED